MIGTIRGLVTVIAAATTLLSALPRERWAESGPASRPFAGRPMGPRGELSPQERREMMEFLRQNMPELARQLDFLARTNPLAAERHSRQAAVLYRRIKDYPPEVRDAALARHRLNVGILRTVRQLRSAKPEEKQQLEDQLKSLIAEQFDKEMIVREYDLQRLGKQLAKLQEETQQRKTDRDTIIQNRLQRARQWGTTSRPVREPMREMEMDRGGI